MIEDKNMKKINFTESQKIKLLNECAQWRCIEGNKIEGFTNEFQVSKASLYLWSKQFNIDICQGHRSKGVPTTSIKSKSFVKIGDLPKIKEKIQKKAKINIKTQYCEIEVPDGLSKESFKNLLESLREVN
jgi:hypothetical protein